jgi:hypothetical protein
MWDMFIVVWTCKAKVADAIYANPLYMIVIISFAK